MELILEKDNIPKLFLCKPLTCKQTVFNNVMLISADYILNSFHFMHMSFMPIVCVGVCFFSFVSY